MRRKLKNDRGHLDRFGPGSDHAQKSLHPAAMTPEHDPRTCTSKRAPLIQGQRPQGEARASAAAPSSARSLRSLAGDSAARALAKRPRSHYVRQRKACSIPMNDLFDKADKSAGRENRDARTISIRGAREHNLKNVDLDIPRDK